MSNIFPFQLSPAWPGEALTVEESPPPRAKLPLHSPANMFSWSLLSALTLAVSFKECLAGDSRSNSDRDWHWPHQSEQLHDCHSIESELSPRLSPGAAIILPGNASFDSFEVRASSPRIEPTFSAVVEVSTEEDVQHTVCKAFYFSPLSQKPGTSLPPHSVWLTVHSSSRSAMRTVARRLSLS